MNNAFFSDKLDPCLSVFTAELVAIRNALQFILHNRVEKSIVCSDSQSAIRAISSHKRDHCILVEILEHVHKLSRDSCVCVFLWIPGHNGIAGNVRADHWAKMAHSKPNVTRVSIGHREYVPQVRKCIAEFFSELWQAYCPTFLKQVKPTTGVWMSSVRSVRKEEVVLARLRLGHTLLTHRHVMDRLPQPICELCRCPLDVTHILLDCRKFLREAETSYGMSELECANERGVSYRK